MHDLRNWRDPSIAEIHIPLALIEALRQFFVFGGLERLESLRDKHVEMSQHCCMCQHVDVPAEIWVIRVCHLKDANLEKRAIVVFWLILAEIGEFEEIFAEQLVLRIREINEHLEELAIGGFCRFPEAELDIVLWLEELTSSLDLRCLVRFVDDVEDDGQTLIIQERFG